LSDAAEGLADRPLTKGEDQHSESAGGIIQSASASPLPSVDEEEDKEAGDAESASAQAVPTEIGGTEADVDTADKHQKDQDAELNKPIEEPEEDLEETCPRDEVTETSRQDDDLEPEPTQESAVSLEVPMPEEEGKGVQSKVANVTDLEAVEVQKSDAPKLKPTFEDVYNQPGSRRALDKDEAPQPLLPTPLMAAAASAHAAWAPSRTAEGDEHTEDITDDRETNENLSSLPPLLAPAPPDRRPDKTTKEVGKLRELKEFWGSKTSKGFAGPELGGTRLSKNEAQASLQRLLAAGGDFDEVRRLRKLIAEVD